jgi:dipeptidyl-peptidase-4
VKTGTPERLTPESGTHSVQFSPDGTKFIDSWTAVDVPFKTVLRKADGTLLQVLNESKDPMTPFAPATVELGTVPSADPSFVNYYRIVKPAGFDPSRKYPLIVYVYGGPHSQMVTDTWLAGIRYWEYLMAQKGYVLYIQDNRGTDNRGYAFARAINRRCGVAETADQVEGIKQLISEGWVDESRIGVVGWSYGGFMTITLLTTHPELFKAGACGGPVIDWKWYEVMYGERYMDTEETNPEGFALTRLQDKTDRLKARLLICQGMEDGTVLPINSLSYMQSCVENNVLPDYYPYPRSEHNVSGPWRGQLYLKLTDFFERFL